MRRIGFILVFCLFVATNGFAVSRTSNTPSVTRSGTTTQKVRTQSVANRQSVRVAKTTGRTATQPNVQQRTNRNSTKNVTRSGVTARATTTETRTGAEYEQCKTAYFACMDQFCQLKNDTYRRCSCSNRITALQSAQNNLQQAGEQLVAFNENLDIVGKTAAQATAMNTASEGELALGRDNSASKALLTAIMNSIRGDNANVENSSLSSLNSLDLSFDAVNSFGTTDIGQNIAAYNGTALYSAVYPNCRTAVKNTCNDSALQRAVNAYLMAIEQDCNTVQTAITNKQKETHAAIRESSAMLDMARAENHKNHNSDDIATCLANVESAILSEEVCGSNYHKCLDNGEYIDVSTGAPISGVIDFYKLGTLLAFSSGRNNSDQKLAQNPNNRTFVKNFEKRVKQFAESALDKCDDDADTVWQDYLNKALLDIYYAQQSKVSEIKQGCFDFVSACYMNGSTAMTNAMQGLVAAQTTTLTPDVLQLNKSLCSDYIESCNNMFDGQIVQDYINNRHDTDSLTACRAVVKQCFDNYGGINYENFYNPSSGLFQKGYAPNWFSLYEIGSDGQPKTENDKPVLVSECAKQLADIDACKDKVEEAFGGFDYYSSSNSIYDRYALKNSNHQKQNRLLRSAGIATEIYNQILDILQTQCSNLDGKFMNIQNLALYSDNYDKDAFCEATFENSASRYNNLYKAYSIGKLATIYNTQSFVSVRPIKFLSSQQENQPQTFPFQIGTTTKMYHENMCPRDYGSNTDVQSWGACLCWENGGRRSNNGTSTRCSATFPVSPLTHYLLTLEDETANTYSAQQNITYGLNNTCYAGDTDENLEYVTKINPSTNKNTEITKIFSLWPYKVTGTTLPTEQDWCTANINSRNQVCPMGTTVTNGECNACPATWIRTGNKCCPSTHPSLQGDYCCPTGYSLSTPISNSNSYVCTIGGSNKTITPYEAQPISSELMQTDTTTNQSFPDG